MKEKCQFSRKLRKSNNENRGIPEAPNWLNEEERIIMEILSPWEIIVSYPKGMQGFFNRFYNRNILKQFRVRIDHGGLVNSRVRCCVPSYWYIHLMNHSTSINLSPNTYTYDFMMTSHNNMNCFLVTLNIFLPKLKRSIVEKKNALNGKYVF